MIMPMDGWDGDLPPKMDAPEASEAGGMTVTHQVAVGFINDLSDAATIVFKATATSIIAHNALDAWDDDVAHEVIDSLKSAQVHISNAARAIHDTACGCDMSSVRECPLFRMAKDRGMVTPEHRPKGLIDALAAIMAERDQIGGE